MTLGQMHTRVKAFLQNRASLDSVINDLINEAIASLAMPFDFPALEKVETVTYTANAESLVWVNTNEPIISVYDVTTNRLLTLEDAEWLDQQDAQASSADPSFFVRYGGSIYLRPIPYRDVTLRIRRKRFPTVLTNDATELTDLPKDWHPIVCKLAASEAHFMVGEDQKGQARLNSALADISARQEIRTMEVRGQHGRIVIDRSRYFRGSRGTHKEWR